MDIKIQSVEIRNSSIEYFSFGSGKKNCLILPGLSIGSVMPMAGQVARAYGILKNEFTVYLFDRIRDVPEGYSVNDMAKDTADAIRALNLNDLYLIGASQGGMIALLLAADYPDLVKKTVVASSCAKVTMAQYVLMKKWIEYAEKRDGENLYLSFAEIIYPEKMFERFKDVFAESGKSVKEEDLDRFIRLGKAAEGFDASGKLEKIKCPVLAIGDKDDKLFGAEGTLDIAKGVKSAKAETYIYEGYGHALYDTAPDFKKRILDFYLK